MILEIDDEQVDLYPNALVFYTVQRQNMGNLTGRSVSFTNNFTAPWSEKNERLFGFARDENSNTALTYSLRPCKMIEGGVESSSNVLYITKAEDRKFSLQIFENIFDYFEAVNGKNISDINPIAPSAWLAPDIDAARLNTDGIVTALVFWGDLVYNRNFFLPSFYYHTIIKSILEFTGLTLEGNILTDPRFTDLIIPFPGEFEYPESYYKQFSERRVLSADVPITNSIDSEEFVFGPLMTVYTHGTFFARVSVGGISYGTGDALELRIRKNGVLVASKALAISIAPGATREIEYTDFVAPGDFFGVYIYSNAMSGPGIDYTIVNGAGVSSFINFTPDSVVHRGLVNWNALWPQISCTDLLKDFFNRFGIIPNQIEGRLILKTLEEIIADVPGAVDWSGKLVNPKNKPISFKTDYAQENLFSYNDLVSDANLGSESLDIANTTLPLRKTLFKSVFGNSNTVQKLGWLAALISVFDVNAPEDTGDFTDGRSVVSADAILQSDDGKIVFLSGGPYNFTIDVLTSGTTVMLKNTGSNTITLIEGAGIRLPTGSFDIDPDKYVILVYDSTAYPEVYLFDVITTTMETTQAGGLRLLTLKDRTVEGILIFDVASRSDYKLGYFIDDALPKDTGFEYFLGQFYPSLEAALQKTKTPTKDYLLNEQDVFGSDPQKMMYDGDGYYLVNKIINFKSERITKVEIFKLM